MNNIKHTLQDLQANYANKMTDSSNYFSSREPWYKGQSLLDIVYNPKEVGYKKRYEFKRLMEYLLMPNNDVCALYGLRRTGKSVMMRQAIAELVAEHNINAENIAYITLEKNTNYTDQEIIECIRQMSTVRYFFIDELSFVKMDLENNALNLLSDEFATQGKKIVISGTFSFALKLLADEVLFDRMRRINTTYFSFKEAKEVLGYDIEKFIQFGGIIIEPQDEKITPQEYMRTAVTNNIVNSLIRSERLYDIGYLVPEIDQAIRSENEIYIRRKLSTLIKIVIDSYVKVLMYNKIVKKPYRFSDIGNIADLIRQRSERDNTADALLNIIRIDRKKYYNILEKVLGSVSKEEIPENTFRAILDILNQIGLIENIYLQQETESCFVTNYLRYGLCDEIVREIGEEILHETNNRYSASLIYDNLKGSIQEAIVYLDLKHTGTYNFDKYSSDAGEVDLVIKHDEIKTMDIYEIKHSYEPLDQHARNIINQEFILELERNYGYSVQSHNVLYNGETFQKKVDPVYTFGLMAEEKRGLKRYEAVEKWNTLMQTAKTFNWEVKTINYINLSNFLCNL